jgi:hypothetical protein
LWTTLALLLEVRLFIDAFNHLCLRPTIEVTTTVKYRLMHQMQLLARLLAALTVSVL